MMLYKVLQIIVFLAVSSLPSIQGNGPMKIQGHGPKTIQGNGPISPLAYTCPQPDECGNVCPDTWDYHRVQMQYTGNLRSQDSCDLTFTWQWENDEGDDNIELVFLCQYGDNSEYCDAGHENQCGTCQNFTIYDINPSRNPSVTYTDTCGYSDEFLEVRESCTGAVVSPTTSPTVTSTTTTVTSTTTTVTSQTTIPPECPGNIQQCSGCPTDWGTPSLTPESVVTSQDLCDVQISWTYHNPIDMLDNPSLVFICIYEANGQYCPNASITTCGTCRSVKFYNLDPLLRPYIDYSDTCSNLDQFVVAEDCAVSTGSPPICPDPSECAGCPSDWTYPDFLIQEIPTAEDLCTVEISWDYDYSVGQEVNPSLDFTCIYSENGQYCGNSPTLTCASCQSIIFYDLDPSLDPIVDYTDTCGNINQFHVAENCVSGPYCPGPLECLGCPADWGPPTFTIEGTLTDEDLCNVEISWVYDYSPEQTANPSLNFLCIYDETGEYCPNRTKTTCGSCKSIIFYDLDPTLRPYIDYGDTCSNVDQFIIGSDCSLVLPTTTTKSTTTSTILPTTITTSTTIPTTTTSTTLPTTTTTSTTIPTTTTKSTTTSTTLPTTTTTSTTILPTTTKSGSSGYCPEYHLCNGCPEQYVPPTFRQNGTLIGIGACDLELTWNYPYSIGEDADIVLMVFVCEYSNFEQCEPLNEDVCASCERFVIHRVNPTRNPIIHYSDSCGYIYDIEITACT